MKAYRFKLDGTREEVHPADNKRFTRDEIIALVGKNPLFTATKDKSVMILDLDLYLNFDGSQPFNTFASKIMVATKVDKDILEEALGEPLVVPHMMLRKDYFNAEGEDNG